MIKYVIRRVMERCPDELAFFNSFVDKGLLERLEHVSHPAMTKLLQRLESKGFIRCVPSARDRRYKVITCTERSAGIHNMILAQGEEVFAELCGTLSAQERASLQHLADAIVQNIDQETLSEPEN